MQPSGIGMELRAFGGRAVLVRSGSVEELTPEDLPLPDGLAPALHEWATVACAVTRSRVRHGEPAALVSERGRRLAGLIACGAGVPVEYADPVHGLVELIAPDEPTPWATGLPISAFTATLTALVVVALGAGLTEISGWLAVLVNVLVGAGSVPWIRHAQSLPVWRWLAYGVIVGLPAAWLTLCAAAL